MFKLNEFIFLLILGTYNSYKNIFIPRKNILKNQSRDTKIFRRFTYLDEKSNKYNKTQTNILNTDTDKPKKWQVFLKKKTVWWKKNLNLSFR